MHLLTNGTTGHHQQYERINEVATDQGRHLVDTALGHTPTTITLPAKHTIKAFAHCYEHKDKNEHVML